MKILDSIKKYANTNRLALINSGESLSYRDLELHSNSLASYLSEIPENKPVLIYGSKENNVMIAMIASLKSSRAYIPLDISFPAERIKDIAGQVGPNIIFDLSESQNSLNLSNILGSEDLPALKIIDKDSFNKILTEYRDKIIEPELRVKNNENAYILFTSGSTGKPKGVQISSNNLDSFCDWISLRLINPKRDLVIMNQAAYSFDLSVSQVYPGLINGLCLYAITKEMTADYALLFDNLKKSQINIWVSTPSFADMCLTNPDFNRSMMKELNTFFFVGETLTKSTAGRLMERFPDSKIINGYGPTEATVAISEIVITKDMLDEYSSLPVGYPMENIKLFIRDEDGKMTNSDKKGELVLCGPSVSKGYFNNPEKIRNHFLK